MIFSGRLVVKLNTELRQRVVDEGEKSIAYLNEQIEQTSISDLRSVLFKLVEEHTESITLAKLSEEYAFKVIDPAVPPETKAKPNARIDPAPRVSPREANPQQLKMPKSGIMMPCMGTIENAKNTPEQTPASLATALFTTTQQRVLGYLFGQPERSFFTNELISFTGAGSGAVQRELKRLTESGLVTVQLHGNQKHYQANPDSPIYTELCGIVQKTFGLAGPLREAFAPLTDKIQAAFVFGSVAKKKDTASSDIDVMIISDTLSYADVMSTLSEVESRLGREVNPTIYTKQELVRRTGEGNAFVNRVLAQPKIWLIGGERDLTA
jgi:predicted nucleotidyltransferase